MEVYFDDFKVTHTKSPVIQQEEYYPFGLTFNSYSRENSTKNNYLYNGKELQDELDIGWVDFGARMYNFQIGRWMTVDNKSDEYAAYSPYSYAVNNPIYFLDPNGKEIISNITLKQTESLNNGSRVTYTAEGSVTLKLKVINSSNQKIDMAELRNTLSGEISKTYSGTGFSQTDSGLGLDGTRLGKVQNISVLSNVKVNVEIEEISSLDKINDNDHVLMIVNNIPKVKDDDIDAAGKAELGGNVAAVEAT